MTSELGLLAPDAMLIARPNVYSASSSAVVDITDEGIDHVWPLKGSVASNARFLENSSCIAASARSSARSGRGRRDAPGRDRTADGWNPRKQWARRRSAVPIGMRLIGLIARRSQVQILPPPPSKTLQTAGLRARCLLFRNARRPRRFPDLLLFLPKRVVRLLPQNPKRLSGEFGAEWPQGGRAAGRYAPWSA